MKTNPSKTSLLLPMLCALCIATPAAADEAPQGTLDRIKASKTIRLGHLAQSIPFSFADDGGTPQGYSVELCQRVAAGVGQQLGIDELKVQWVPVTLADRFDKVIDGSVDLECGISTMTLSRREKVDFSLMTWVDGGSFVVRAGQPHGGLGDLDGRKIAVIAGTTTEASLAEALKKDFVKAEIVKVNEHIEGLQALGQGKVDAYAADQTVLIGLALVLRDKLKLELADRNFSFEPYGLTLRRNDQDFKLAVDRVLSRLYRTGQVSPIYDRWFGKLGKPSSLLRAMFAIEGLPE
ncbi:MAG TPA: amino acid ABC transporter substrate-binding protein [Burkholderiales bacterium]|nr:amino acid ABC transporter substrate-binding protein [Burkholderiales bacterium]